MSLADLTREAALAEAATVGRSEFLKRYGFGPAREYFVLWDGARYDSKAIPGVATAICRGNPRLSARTSPEVRRQSRDACANSFRPRPLRLRKRNSLRATSMPIFGSRP